MTHAGPLVATLVVALALAFAFGLAARLLRLPPLLGYIAAGIAVGPHTPGFVADASVTSSLAEIGVALLLFAVGLHFRARDLVAVWRVAVPGALAQVTAAALCAELKALAHPVSVDTIPTSANKEDHVSMSMAAALKAARAVELATLVVAVELLCASEGLDLLAPLTTSTVLAAVHAAVRARVARRRGDRPPSPDITAIAAIIAGGALDHIAGPLVN